MNPSKSVARSTYAITAAALLAASPCFAAIPAPPSGTAEVADAAVVATAASEPPSLTAESIQLPIAPGADVQAAGEVPPAPAAQPAPVEPPAAEAVANTGTRSGREVYEKFKTGLSNGHCDTSKPRWRDHFSSAPERLAATNSQVMPVFAHVVEALREARLPTEYALIPFVESEYRPQARSAAGPAGLWQFIASTARSLKLTVGQGVDGRMSPIESTRAAVQYLTTLHKRFGGNWRLAAMAYNAGENRVHSELRRSGQSVQDAGPQHLGGLPSHTRSYVEKLHALSCMMHRAGDREEWVRSLDRPVRALGSTRGEPKG